MNSERERYKGLPADEELDEDMIILSFAAREEIPFDWVFDGLMLEIDRNGFDKYFENREEQQYYMLIALLYDKMPNRDLDYESAKLRNALRQYKSRFLEDPEVIRDIEGYESVVAMNLPGLADFASRVHADYFDEAKSSEEAGILSSRLLSKLLLWSKLDQIAGNAAEKFGESRAA